MSSAPDPDDVNFEMSRDDIDEWDSLNHLRVITAVEKEYDVSLTMDQIESVDSIQRLSTLIAPPKAAEQAS